MIWLAWRQLRTEIMLVGLLALVLLVLFVPTGFQIRDHFRSEGLAQCVAISSNECDAAVDRLEDRFATVSGLTDWFAILPILIGILVAAPLVLELERRSYRLAWTQSIGRNRWIVTKLIMVGAVALVAGAVLSVLLTWWRSPLDRLTGRLDPGVFQIEGPALASYCIFGAALVVMIGALLRRTIPGVVLATILFITIRVVIETWIRPHYLSSMTGSGQTPDQERQLGWVLSQEVTASGEVFTYHPDSRFWTFQAIESVLFVALSLSLLALAGAWMSRRLD